MPLLVSSAVRRSGTTLVQRLLCSASNTLIYGESCAYEIIFLLHVYQSKQLNFSTGKLQRDELLKQVLNGKVDDWITDLMPPVDDFLEVHKKNLERFINYLENYASQQDRPIWGVKMAEWQSHQLLQVKRFFPDTKLVYIQRDLAACARSALQLQIITNEEELRRFCHTWKNNTQLIEQQFPADKVFFLDYQKLIDQPQIVIPQLEQFCGASDIKASVLKKKINTFKFDTRQDEEGHGYISAQPLNEEQHAIIQQFT